MVGEKTINLEHSTYTCVNTLRLVKVWVYPVSLHRFTGNNSNM